MKKTYYFVLFSAILFFLLHLDACTGQRERKNTCAVELTKAHEALNSFYQNGDSTLLQIALTAVDSATECANTRRSAVEMKLSLLMLMKKYVQGTNFVDSLSPDDFKLPYKKEMSAKSFEAMTAETKGDTDTYNRIFTGLAADISNYITEENLPNDRLDEEATYDLLVVKSRYLDKSDVYQAVDSLVAKHPQSKDFLNAIRSSLYGSSKIILPNQ